MIRLVEMSLHHIMKEGVTARQDGSWDTGVFSGSLARHKVFSEPPANHKVILTSGKEPSVNLGNNTSAGPEGVPHDYRNI